MTSARLTPIAATLTRSWCGPGTGRSTVTWIMDSGPPNRGVRIACIVGMGVSVFGGMPVGSGLKRGGLRALLAWFEPRPRSIGDAEAGQHLGANGAAEELADSVSRQFIQRDHQPRTVVVGHVLHRAGDALFPSGGWTLDRRQDHLTPIVRGHADDSHFRWL